MDSSSDVPHDVQVKNILHSQNFLRSLLSIKTAQPIFFVARKALETSNGFMDIMEEKVAKR